MLFNRMFPFDSILLGLDGEYLYIRVKPQFRYCWHGLCGIAVGSGGEISYTSYLFESVPKTRLAASILASWRPVEVVETPEDEWFTAWRTRIAHKWDGKNPIVKALREMRGERVGVRRSRSVGKAPRQRPLTKHKWK